MSRCGEEERKGREVWKKREEGGDEWDGKGVGGKE